MFLKKYYVSLTWDEWPEGGSYGTTVMAEDPQDAEKQARNEMAISRADEQETTVEDILMTYANDWHVVDCFKVEDFLKNHINQETP